DVLDYVKTFEIGSKLLLLAPVHIPKERSVLKTLEILSLQGYARIKYQGKVHRISDIDKEIDHNFSLVVDRIIVKDDEDFYNRLADAVDTAFFEGKGICTIEDLRTSEQVVFSTKFEMDGIEFLEPNTHLFSVNNPYGACPSCEGYGDMIGLDEDLIVPNTSLSVFENAIFPWRGESMSWYRDQLVNNAYKFDFPIHKPWFELTEDQKSLVWEGNKYFTGLTSFFKELEDKSYKIQNRVMLSRYRGKTRCPQCKGLRLRKEANYVRVNDKTISDLVNIPISRLSEHFDGLELDAHDKKIASRLLKEINTRLEFLKNVGLNYLSLNRKSNSLSGGESQRINLATSLGSSLVGSMYILDEPSIG